MSRVDVKPRPAQRNVLDVKPLRLFDAAPQRVGDGQWRLTVPLKPAAWVRFFTRPPAGLTKAFELDDVGKAVWDACDGDTPIRTIITSLAAQRDLNLREVEVATLAFVKTLVQKGLVGIPMTAEESD